MTIRIDPSNVAELRLWSEIYGDCYRNSRGRGLSKRDAEAAEQVAADEADRAVLALRERTSELDSLEAMIDEVEREASGLDLTDPLAGRDALRRVAAMFRRGTVKP